MSDTDHAVGKLFTNSQHSIIYLDDKLQHMLKADVNWFAKILGQPVYDLFRMPADSYQQLVSTYDVSQQVQIPIDMWLSAEHFIPTIVTPSVKHNYDGKLMGIDYQVHLASKQSIPINIQVIEDDMLQELKQLYMRQQLEELYQVALQWGGKSLAQYISTVINSTAQEHQWALEISDGKTKVTGELASDAHMGLLTKTTSYMSTLLGQKLIHKHIEAVNKKTNAELLKHINHNWYKSI